MSNKKGWYCNFCHSERDGDHNHGCIHNQKKVKVSTGLCDSNGEEIFVGDLLKKPTSCNEDLHGSYALYEVKQQGLTPIISYVESETGEQLPRGYLAAPLSDEYDRKMFCFSKKPMNLRPDENVTIFKKDERPL